MSAKQNKISQNYLIDALKAILLSDTVGTQEAIKKKLLQQGFDINQSKISRLLHRMGAIKTTNEHKQVIYSLPRDPLPSPSKNLFIELIVSITHNESLIVIQTNPGSASFIGRLLDYHRETLHILGTVAGDDTLFIAPHSIKKIAAIQSNLQHFLASHH